LAAEYRFIVERAEDGLYLARAVEFPTVFAHGASPNDCEKKIREALKVAVASMFEAGQLPPLPAGERRAQVNMRVTADEKSLLEESARHAGFRGLSDFVRFAALSFARGEPGRKAG
jgi:predicted RNase H-like HicB family nuclease